MQDFKKNLKEITDICKFEFWIRFYFIKQEDEEFKIEVPEKTMDHIREEYSLLSDLAEQMNHQSITPEKSQNLIVHYINNKLDAMKKDHTIVPSVLNSKSFEVEISAFHLWVNAHEEQLAEEVMDFKEWMQLFEAWKRTESGYNTLQNLTTSSSQVTNKTQ